MESKTLSMNTSYSDILKSIGLSSISNGSFSPMHNFVTLSTGYLENTGSLSYMVLSNVDTCTTQLQYITVITTTDCIFLKMSSTEKLSSSQ